MWVAVDKGVRCQRCDAPLTELGWVACLRCLYASPAQIRGFDIGDELGRGGMGVVYRARQRDLDRDVALKVLDPELAGDPELRARFAREARLLARLAHPNIV